jgi:hypothetical protein
MVSFIWNVKNMQIYSCKKYIGGYPGYRDGGMVELLLNG